MELSGVETRECQKCIHQPPDMDVHSPGIPVERVVPHLLQEPPAGKSHAIVWHQVVKQVKLPRFDLLHYLMPNYGVALSRGRLLEQVWDYSFYGDARTVDVHIRRLVDALL